MEMSTGTLLVVVLILVCIFAYLSRRDERMPPGPFRWPLVGNIFSIIPREYIAYTRWRHYGELLTVHFGLENAVVLNSYRSFNEAFVGQGDVFSGRIRSEYFDRIIHDSGIIFLDGQRWKEHRRFTIRMLRDFGLGRDVGETIVREECEALCSKLETLTGKNVDSRSTFSAAVNNIIARLTFGERSGTDDPNFMKFTKTLDESFNFRLVDLLPVICPWILRVPPLLRFIENISKMRYRTDEMHEYIQEKIEARKKAIDNSPIPITELSQATNLCEAYLIEQRQQEEASPGDHTYTEWQITRNTLELFLAGTDTTSTALAWATLLLALQPNIQQQVQKEIKEKIGQEDIPKMSDLKELPYVHAVMDEVLRFSSLVPSGVGHRTLQDTELMGYFIPKDTMIIANIHGIHHDPELWERPHQFYPAHFLDNDGNYQPSKHLIPFSVGKRACLGEGLAKMEYFIAFASVMQRFQVRLKNSDRENLREILAGTVGAVRKPLPHSIIFTKIG